MNNTQFAVMQSQHGSLTLTNQANVLHWELLQAGYTEVESGSKKKCEQFIEEYMAENFAIQE